MYFNSQDFAPYGVIGKYLIYYRVGASSDKINTQHTQTFISFAHSNRRSNFQFLRKNPLKITTVITVITVDEKGSSAVISTDEKSSSAVVTAVIFKVVIRLVVFEWW